MKNLLVSTLALLAGYYTGLAQDVAGLDQLYLARRVIVNVTVAWNGTGVVLNAGDSVTVVVNGMASTALNGLPTWLWLGPEGGAPNVKHPMPFAPGLSVIGKIGSSGSLFYVGRTFSFRTNVAGELYLGYNDDLLSDNYGYYVAYIFCKTCSGLQPTSASGQSLKIPTQPDIEQNYPNPFNPSTTIKYDVAGRANVTVKIYDSIGRLVRTLLNEEKEAGSHSVVWDGRGEDGKVVSTGTYFYQVQMGDFFVAKKMVMLK